MSLQGDQLPFIIFAVIAIYGGLFMIMTKKVVHMIISLVFTFISIACLYILLLAEFVAVVQILIYSGAITIMMLFGIMLTKHKDETKKKINWKKNVLVFISIVTFGIVVFLGIYKLDFGTVPQALHENNTEQIGMSLYSHYIIPFELTSVILLVALIGAIILARKEVEEE
ncbi:NADH-quinone oxidoreductase subunit J [Metabacillus fastidiosus]|uniref:NADH-quinone oxidoreductase subunit J n=1 Tax=Metabacillus fastidiosus TaxID=1458 RepID=A0ABU6P3E6_9BACI|nr:NADH-quinone oxidoreductase subunit J [Metabacillus fastidiosus]MED4403890.1 NADH-quinone oxidoreductase subunit J [Metabacillus fastidiosus]MED4464434.1 NADH-quinone oxidoreductase subunit J [Metabacillus fastidiosus]